MDLTGLQALQQIMTIYGDTNSLEGTYDLFLKIKQDLERLEAINKVWHENEPMESVDINANHLQELYDLTNKLTQENEKIKKAFKILTQRIVIKAHRNFLFGDRHLDIASTTIKLTDEEYDLLKEVLGNENHSE